MLRETVFGQHGNAQHSPLDRRPVAKTSITGTVVDVSPHIINLRTAAGDKRLILSPRTVAWRGSVVPPARLRAGDVVVVRHLPGRNVAEHVWAQIGRVTGTIIETDGSELLVDEGPTRRGRQIVRVDAGSFRQIQVRFPRLEAGFLIDVIGTRQEGYLRAFKPATAQPPYRADQLPAAPLISGRLPESAGGSAVWHEPGEEPPGLLGLAYPALDPETNCGHADAAADQPYAVDPHTAGPGCIRLPLLSIGSAVEIRNEYSGLSATLPVTSCGAAARLFCDRCVVCDTSPRGRIADLTVTAFVELGGNLEDGCFNATLRTAGGLWDKPEGQKMDVGGIAVLGTAREIQVPLLAVLLLGGCAAKVRRAICTRSIPREMGPTALFPVRLRRPVAIVVCVSELGLGVGLLVTAGRFGAGSPALAVRSLTVVLFGTAVGALHVLRTRRPAAGCGCFGDLSDTPVNWRTLTRTALLFGAAVAGLGAPALHMAASAQAAIVVLAVLIAEVSVLVALSPEFAAVMVRLGYNEPCEVRRLPVARSLTALRASAQWRSYHRYLITKEPADVWREGCWRFAVFPGMLTGRRVEVVFAVYLKPRRPQVLVGVFDCSAASRTLPEIPRPRQAELLPAPATEDSVVL